MDYDTSTATSIKDPEDETYYSSVECSTPNSEDVDDIKLSNTLLPCKKFCPARLNKRELTWEVVQQIRSELKRGLFIIDALQNTREDEDDVDVFFKSIAMCVKKFSPSLQAEAKYQVLLAVTSLENGTCGSSLRPSCHCRLN